MHISDSLTIPDGISIHKRIFKVLTVIGQTIFKSPYMAGNDEKCRFSKNGTVFWITRNNKDDLQYCNK